MKIMFVTGPVECNMINIFKDTCLAYYFSKLSNYHVIVDDWYDPDFPNINQFRTLELQRYDNRNVLTKLAKVLKVFKLARKIDILYTFQIGIDSCLKMIAYRLGGGKGKIYLKLDLEMEGYRSKKGKDLLIWKNMPFYLKIAHKFFKPLPDILSVETKPVYNRLQGTYYGDLIKNDKLIIVPNGVDSELLNELRIERKSISSKEKIILTVGRIGTHQKNTELLLDVLAHTDLKEWKVYLIGPIESSFKIIISDFYEKYPQLKEQVIFLGKISQKELYDYYNRARVFVLTSRHESFAFVLAEAAYMHDYLISSNVGVAHDLYSSGIPESLVTTMDVDFFSRELQKIINLSDCDLNSIVKGIDTEILTWEYILVSSGLITKLT